MDNYEAAERAEQFVFEHLAELLSMRIYFAKALMKTLVSNVNKAAENYQKMCETLKRKTNGLIEDYHIHDTAHNNAPYKAKKMDLLTLALNYKRYGGMDIVALSLDTSERRWAFAPKLSLEAIEVKVDRKCRYLHLDKPWPPVRKGAIGFEIWDNVWCGDSDEGRKKERRYWQPGWLFGYLYPNKKTQKNVERSKRKYEEEGKRQVPATYCTPSVLVYLLTDENSETNELQPYAAIAFENIETLLTLLKTKAGGELWPNWTIDPETVARERLYSDEIHDNMLYVPIEELMQLEGVTVTMLGEIPAEERVHYWATIKQGAEKYWANKQRLYRCRREYLLFVKFCADQIVTINADKNVA